MIMASLTENTRSTIPAGIALTIRNTETIIANIKGRLQKEEDMDNQKTVLFLACFGTSILRAKEVSYDQIQADLAKVSGLPVWQIYTDDDTARAVNGIGGMRIYTVEDALETAIIHGFTRVITVPVFFAEGALYKGLRNRLDFYRDRIDIVMTKPVIYNNDSAAAVADILIDCIKPVDTAEYLFVGHGAGASDHTSYAMLEDALRAKGFENVRVLKLKEKDCAGQAFTWLKQREADLRDAQVEIVPLVVAWGDYMAGELYNSNDSLMWQLRKNGFRTVFTGKGLGEYEPFRQIYEKRLEAVAE